MNCQTEPRGSGRLKSTLATVLSVAISSETRFKNPMRYTAIIIFAALTTMVPGVPGTSGNMVPGTPGTAVVIAGDLNILQSFRDHTTLEFWRSIHCLTQLKKIPEGPHTSSSGWLNPLIRDQLVIPYLQDGDQSVSALMLEYPHHLTVIRSVTLADTAQIVHTHLFHRPKPRNLIFRGCTKEAILFFRNHSSSVIESQGVVTNPEDLIATMSLCARIQSEQIPTSPLGKLIRLKWRLPDIFNPLTLEKDQCAQQIHQRQTQFGDLLHHATERNPQYFGLLSEDFVGPSLFAQEYILDTKHGLNSRMSAAQALEKAQNQPQKERHIFQGIVGFWRDKPSGLWHIGFSLRKGHSAE